MASVILNGDTSGSVTLAAPAVAGSNTQTLVATTGTLAPIVSGAVQTASGASVDFTGIPSWAKRITVMLNGVGFAAATGLFKIRIGSGTLSTTGYSSISGTTVNAATGSTSSFTDGLAGGNTTVAGATYNMVCVITNISGNNWIATSIQSRSNDTTIGNQIGQITLSGALNILSVVATTSTFNAGTINILYE